MIPAIRGGTRVAGVIGDPIVHSRSPQIHNAGYAALGLDWVFVAFPTPAGRGAAALEAMRTLGIAGLSVTMPHKRDVAVACDELSERAAALGVVNAVWDREGTLVGDSTDGEGFLRALVDAGIDDVAATQVAVLGAGGAARAITHSLGAAGARVKVVARRERAAEDVASLAPDGTTASFNALDDAIQGCDVLVNATPLGMAGEDVPVSTAGLATVGLVFDTVYGPTQTPLLARAADAGIAAVNGIGMLVHQAAIAFEAFTGQEAPLEAMRAAATS